MSFNVDEIYNEVIKKYGNNKRLAHILGVANTALVNVGGIACLNTAATSNISQIISFTINYGSLYAFGAKYDHRTSQSKKDCKIKCGGIMSEGICNIINVVNYGKIYSSENAGGMISTIDLSKFNSTNVNIANALNYSAVYGFNSIYSAGGSQQYATYQNLIDVETNSTVYANVIKDTGDSASAAGLKDVRFELEQEGDVIVSGSIATDIENTVAKLTLPAITGKYILRVTFTFDGITYSESFIVRLEKEEAK